VVSSLNTYDLKFDTSFSPPKPLQQSHLSNSPSFKHITAWGRWNWLRILHNSGLRETGFGREEFGPRNSWVIGFVNDDLWVSQWVQVAADRRKCQVSLPETQTAGNSSSSPGSWPPPIPTTRQSSRWRHRKCWHKTPVELIKLCHPLLTPYVTTTILGEVLISW